MISFINTKIIEGFRKTVGKTILID